MGESEIYIRDHLLIQFMISTFYHPEMKDVERVYELWIEWLNEKHKEIFGPEEENHDERSKI